MEKNIQFKRSNEPGTRITLTAVGDIMMQAATQRSTHAAMDPAIIDPEERVASGFLRLFDEVNEALNQGDLLFGNLETPTASNLLPRSSMTEQGLLLCDKTQVPPGVLYDGGAYQAAMYPHMLGSIGPPNFNAHPALTIALKQVGFDIVATANNHILDRGHNGIDQTIDALREAGLDFVGILRSNEVTDRDPESYPSNRPYVVKEAQGVKLAFFSLTSFQNKEFVGYKDQSNQVYLFPRRGQHKRRARLLESITQARNDPEVDLVIISAHWGYDLVSHVFRWQRRLAHQMFDAGADLILGHHPHVLQPMEKYLTPDGRETLVIYSLGNFISDMKGTSSQTTVILYVGITKNTYGTFLNSAQFTPVARHVRIDQTTGTQLIQPVIIDQYPPHLFTKHRNRVIKFLGKENWKQQT
jgi:poly-gamma-glutamate synthesis protein (capsule biosynthesis protein)